MGRTGSGTRRRPRWIFQVETGGDRPVIKVFDTESETVCREIPIQEFLDYARAHKDLAAFLLGKVAPNETPRPLA